MNIPPAVHLLHGLLAARRVGWVHYPGLCVNGGSGKGQYCYLKVRRVRYLALSGECEPYVCANRTLSEDKSCEQVGGE